MKNLKNNIVFYLLCLYIVLMPLGSNDIKLWKIPLSGESFLALIFLIYIILVIFSKDYRKKLKDNLRYFFTNKFFILVLLLLIYMIYTISFCPGKSEAIRESLRFMTYIGLMFIIISEVNNQKRINSIINSFMILLSIQCFIGVLQHFTGFLVGTKFTYENYIVKYRIPSTMENPNTFGAFLILFVFPIIMCAIKEKNKNKKILYSSLSVLIIINILLTFSRNAILGLAVGSVLLIILYSIKLIFLFGGLGVILMFIPVVNLRLHEFLDKSQNESRIKIWQCALKIIEDYPIRGIGNGNFFRYYNMYQKNYSEFRITAHEFYSTHNSYLKVWAELGVFGICVFVSLLSVGLYRIKKVVKFLEEGRTKNFFIGFIASYGAFVVMNFSDNLLFVPKCTAYFWIIMGLCESVIYRGSASK